MCDIVPDGVQHAGCDALSSGQTEDPDPTDPTQSLFWDGGAAPGSVSLHEVVLRHVFVSIRLLEDSVRLEGQKIKKWNSLLRPHQHQHKTL